MTKTQAEPAPFDLCAGHPVLDFVNSLDHRFGPEDAVELLADYAALLRFTEQARLLDSRQVRRLSKSVNTATAERVQRAAKELREALASVLYDTLQGRPASTRDLGTLEQHFHSASEHRELRWKPRAAMEWDWGRFQTNAALPLWMLAQTASQLLLSEAVQRVRACAADPCRWLFLDTSKNHTRRWCNMQVCGNRMKARRFQARQ
jgi:predicted RNA-binding Zn ribbon-like protein